MRVAFVGNLCNLGYTFARALRQRGIEAHTYVSGYEMLEPTAVPGWEDPSLGGSLPGWVYVWNAVAPRGGPARKLRTLRATLALLRRLQGYDLVYAIGENAIPVYLACAARGQPWVLHGAGSEVREYAFERSPRGALLRRALRAAPLALLSNQDMLAATDRLGAPHARYLPLPIDTQFYAPAPAPPAARPALFHPTRLDWTTRRARGGRRYAKGNDRLLRAFARLVALGHDWELQVVAHGVDVAPTWELCRQLGIAARTTRLPPLDKARLVARYNAAAVVADHFDYGGLTLITLEAMACAKPVVMHVDHRTAAQAYGPDLPPVPGAATEDEITERLVELADPTARQAVGEAARAWILRHHTLSATAARLEAYFHQLVGS